MERFIHHFAKIKTRYERNADRDHSLICKVGFYGSCPVMKLQKAAWTNDDMGMTPNQTGIFFSIWLDDKSLKQQRVLYNIHALKLRQLSGYKITSIDFAKEFRKRFEPMQCEWPNVRVDFGPQTLMQGWVAIAEKTLERDLLKLMKKFSRIGPMIDRMLTIRQI